MTCKEIEKELQNGNMTDDIRVHLEQCDSCKLYESLITFSPMALEPLEDITAKINSAFKEADQIKKKHDLLSLLMFVVLACTLMSSILLVFNDSTGQFVIQYLLVISVVMPFTLPLIALYRRKVVSNDN